MKQTFRLYILIQRIFSSLIILFLLVFNTHTFGQDENKKPLIGATISEKENITNAAVTNADGVFTLRVSNEKSIVEVRFVGYEPYEFTVGTKRIISIVLQPSVSDLEQVVVVGYGKQAKSFGSAACHAIGIKVQTISGFCGQGF